MPDPGYPQQYSASCIKAGSGAGQIGRAEYDDCHKAAGSISWRPPGVFHCRGPRCRLWMKFPKRNIYSTCRRRRFRRSAAQAGPKFFSFHSFPHRLCTSYARYCTGYPQPLTRAGLEAELLAASVAGYLFFGARYGCQRRGETVQDGLLQPAGTANVENLWIVGITPAKARTPAGLRTIVRPRR
jgi:hypothetical protein